MRRGVRNSTVKFHGSIGKCDDATRSGEGFDCDLILVQNHGHVL